MFFIKGNPLKFCAAQLHESLLTSSFSDNPNIARRPKTRSQEDI